MPDGTSGRALDQILTSARRNNAAAAVTGALLHNHGFFAQVLEGPWEAVQTVFERILLDPRHREVVVLEALETDHRVFADWAMAYTEPRNTGAAGQILSSALANPADRAGSDVLALLDRVVRREAEDRVTA
jgi:hypothetical protein